MKSLSIDGASRKLTTPVPEGWNEQVDLAYLEDWMGAPHPRGRYVLLDNLSDDLKHLTEELQRITLYFVHEKHIGLCFPIPLPVEDQARFLCTLIEASSIDRELAQRLCQVVQRCSRAIVLGNSVTVDCFVDGTHYWRREIMEPMLMLRKVRFELWNLCHILVGLRSFEPELLLPENRDFDEQIVTVEDDMFSFRQSGEWTRICSWIDQAQ
ncbi:MAG: hypothetical protein H0X66_21205 [Verrucomicrobia bacterium]|nr:hypothetical protein [Verrucomicrobiota bacterium]